MIPGIRTRGLPTPRAFGWDRAIHNTRSVYDGSENHPRFGTEGEFDFPFRGLDPWLFFVGGGTNQVLGQTDHQDRLGP